MDKTFIERYKSYFLPIVILLAGAGVIILNLTSFGIPENYLAKGKKAYQDENYVQAIRDFAKAQQYCETDIEARFLLGASYHNYGWNDEALQQYEDTWKLCAVNGARARHNAGKIWLQKGVPEKAVDYFRQALTLQPKADDIWFELGNVLVQLNRPVSALAAFEEAFRLVPNNNFYRRKCDDLRKVINSQKRVR